MKEHPLMPTQMSDSNDPVTIRINRCCISTDKLRADWVKLLYLRAEEKNRTYSARAKETIEPVVSNLFRLMDEAVNSTLKSKVSCLHHENRSTKFETQNLFRRFDRVLNKGLFDGKNNVYGLPCRLLSADNIYVNAVTCTFGFSTKQLCKESPMLSGNALGWPEEATMPMMGEMLCLLLPDY